MEGILSLNDCFKTVEHTENTTTETNVFFMIVLRK